MIQNLKIMVLTGHISIKEKLKEYGLPEYPIISKPITINEIKKVFNYYSITP